MSESFKKYISPIAIDMGAKNTACYFAHYKKGSSLSEISKKGKVFHLEKDKFTLLMSERTSKRHQRRGFQRRKLAKRLLVLILEQHFGMSLSKKDEQAVGFLLNRRGFTFLTEEYDQEILRHFPLSVYKYLPPVLTEDVEKKRG